MPQSNIFISAGPFPELHEYRIVPVVVYQTVFPVVVAEYVPSAKNGILVKILEYCNNRERCTRCKFSLFELDDISNSYTHCLCHALRHHSSIHLLEVFGISCNNIEREYIEQRAVAASDTALELLITIPVAIYPHVSRALIPFH